VLWCRGEYKRGYGECEGEFKREYGNRRKLVSETRRVVCLSLFVCRVVVERGK
jgi:hypothetical protein